MTTRTLAAALCCPLLAACGSLSEYQRDADWGQTGPILNYTERAR